MVSQRATALTLHESQLAELEISGATRPVTKTPLTGAQDHEIVAQRLFVVLNRYRHAVLTKLPMPPGLVAARDAMDCERHHVFTQQAQ